MVRDQPKISIRGDKWQNLFTLKNRLLHFKQMLYDYKYIHLGKTVYIWRSFTSHRLYRTHGWKLMSSRRRGLMKDKVKSGIPLSLIRQSICNKKRGAQILSSEFCFWVNWTLNSLSEIDNMYILSTLHQFLFMCEKFSWGSREPCRHKYFSLRTSPQMSCLLIFLIIYILIVKTNHRKPVYLWQLVK